VSLLWARAGCGIPALSPLERADLAEPPRGQSRWPQGDPEPPSPLTQHPGAIGEHQLRDPDHEQDEYDQPMAAVNPRQPGEPLRRIPPGARPEDGRYPHDARGHCSTATPVRRCCICHTPRCSARATCDGMNYEVVGVSNGDSCPSVAARPRCSSRDAGDAGCRPDPGIASPSLVMLRTLPARTGRRGRDGRRLARHVPLLGSTPLPAGPRRSRSCSHDAADQRSGG